MITDATIFQLLEDIFSEAEVNNDDMSVDDLEEIVLQFKIKMRKLIREKESNER